MRVAVPKENDAGERRVAIVPDAVGRLAPLGFSFAVEQDAGRAAGFLDDDYAAAGAEVVPGRSCSPLPMRSCASARPSR